MARLANTRLFRDHRSNGIRIGGIANCARANSHAGSFLCGSALRASLRKRRDDARERERLAHRSLVVSRRARINSDRTVPLHTTPPRNCRHGKISRRHRTSGKAFSHIGSAGGGDRRNRRDTSRAIQTTATCRTGRVCFMRPMRTRMSGLRSRQTALAPQRGARRSPTL